MMANQVSAYNGCCKIYAPRYRQANIFAYFRGDDIRKQALGFAYQDVRRAFQYFLQRIIARAERCYCQSQPGTHHGIRLLEEVIDGTPVSA